MRLNPSTAKVLAAELDGIITAGDLMHADGKPISNAEFNMIPSRVSEIIPYERENVYKIAVSKKITIFFVYVPEEEYSAQELEHYPCWIIRK